MSAKPFSGEIFRDYIIRVLNGMALGLFSSLIIGLIIKQLAGFMDLTMLSDFGRIAQFMMGPAIGAGVAYSVKASPLGIFASMIAGAIGAGTVTFEGAVPVLHIGEPMGALIASLAGAEFSKLIQGRTRVDIVLVPAGTILAGGFAGIYAGPWIASMMYLLGNMINMATRLHPFPMGILVSVMMGIILTLPISSAALAISLGLSGLAAGAATVGCSCQMIGFAVQSYRENKVGGLISQGLGTSMIQIPNIVRNPMIWIPPILSSAILGPVATVIFQMQNNKIGAGMGTSGLVGQFGTLAEMGSKAWPGIISLHFILPAVLTLMFSEYMRKKGWIKAGDMSL
ncbi:MAG TPA: PTS sugar transporter subunit IIC [Synergistales bacterium]|nr:PTS sugar transporter subunit IIC [Synergistales bacterium]